MSKYNNNKITIDGICFDSKDEARYYERLKRRKAEEKILNFELQPKYELQPKFRTPEGTLVRAIGYSPDYLIYHLDGSLEAVDVKTLGTATQQGEIRRKMFLYHYPQIKLTWVCRNLKRATIDGEWILYDDLKKAINKEKRV